ncbi:MAG: ABC transporter ATP-binding protein [Xanthobacteraceae bacterium]|nr:MAG: ABC transporter ATP-binding protein [Xanthobacteraceae bacterium]
MIALAATGITKTYGGFTALSDVSLSVEHGEIRALIGPNGAGKSTLIDALSGRNPCLGRVELMGADISRLTPGKRRRLGLSRSFQKTSIFPRMTVRAQIELAARAVDGSDGMDVLDEFDLRPLADRLAGDIGYGDQRRLDLALAMTGQPHTLLLDEPAAGLSFEESKRLAAHLRDIAARRGVTVVIVEHDMDVVFAIADTITVLQLGQVLAEGRPDDIRANPDVVRAYLGSAA